MIVCACASGLYVYSVWAHVEGTAMVGCDVSLAKSGARWLTSSWRDG